MKFISDSFTKRVLITAMLAGGGALSVGAYAVTPAGNPAKMDCAGKHGKHIHKNQAERMEQRAKRLAGLKAKLNLTVQQEAAWDTYSATRQGAMHPMGDRQAMKAEFAKMTTPQRVDKMLEISEMRRVKMVERSQATKSFYAQLTPSQQVVFDAEARFRGHGRGGHHQKS